MTNPSTQRLPRNFFDDAAPFKLDGAYCKAIPLTQGQLAIVDVEDYPAIARHLWYAMVGANSPAFYAVRHSPQAEGKNHLIYMAREVLGLVYMDEREADHIDIIATTDNRHKNLRIVNDQQQQWHKRRYVNNRTGFKGVSYCRERGNYLACITINGRTKNLGRRPTAEEAHALYCQAANKIQGQFAEVNQ